MVNDFLDKSGIMALWNRAKNLFITAHTPETMVSTNPLNADLLDGHPGSYYLDTSDVVDNLTSTSTTEPLSANQGRVLNGNIAAAIAAIPAPVDNLTSTATSDALSANQGRVLKGLIDGLPTPVDNLISTSITEPLSANQGKVLKGLIDGLPTPVDNLTSTSTTEPLSANQGKVLKDSLIGKAGTGTNGEIFNDYTNNVASGDYSHTEGLRATASGYGAHAEGTDTVASGGLSHTEGIMTQATRQAQHVFGRWNTPDSGGANVNAFGNYVEIVGNGIADNERSNARTLDWDGNEVLAGKLTVGAAPTNNMDVATKQYVDNHSSPVVDNLTSTSTTSGLSANQGKVLNDTKAPIASPTFTGAAKVASGTDYTTAKLRNVILSTSEPTASDGADGDIWIVYTAE